MDIKQNVRAGWYRVKEYLPRFGKSEKGSPTMEYVIIIAVGALFAAILYNIFKDEDSAIKTELSNKVKSIISGQDVEGGKSQNPSGGAPAGGAKLQ